jgi:hypothetical protein
MALLSTLIGGLAPTMLRMVSSLEVYRNATAGLPSGVGAVGTNFVAWDGLMAERMSVYKVRAFAAAALPHFPKLRYSDFGAGVAW